MSAIENLFEEKVRTMNPKSSEKQIEKLAKIAELAYSMKFYGIESIAFDKDGDIDVVTKDGDCDGFIDLFVYGSCYVSDL